MRVLFFILAIFVLGSCKNEGNGVAKSSKRDTSLTLAMYMSYGLKGIEYGPARKIQWDTLIATYNKDSSDFKGKWERYTVYDVEISIPIKDTLTAKTFGINNTDTVIRRILRADAKYVRDGITDWDSTMKYLRQYIDTSATKSK